MAIDLKKSTASQEILLGPFLDDDDGITQKTGLTIANTDIKLFKTGATAFTNKNSGGATELANGFYYAVLDATDTDTAGPLVIKVQVTDCLCVRHEFNVLRAEYYDAKYGSGNMPVDVQTIKTQAITCSAGVTVSPYVGNATAAIAVDGSGYVTYANTAPLDAAGVRTAVGLATANLDTQLGDLPTALENADALLNRDMSAVSDTNARSPLNALRSLRNKVSLSGATMTVAKEDDTTSAWTAAVTTSASADPVTAIDPA